jgi:hypothetical protein
MWLTEWFYQAVLLSKSKTAHIKAGLFEVRERTSCFDSCTVHYQICRNRPTSSLSCMLLYFHDGFYMLRQNNAILKEQQGYFLSYFSVLPYWRWNNSERSLAAPWGWYCSDETCSSHRINKEAYNLQHLLVNLCIKDELFYCLTLSIFGVT